MTTGYTFIGGPAASKRWIRAPFCWRIPCSAGILFLHHPTLVKLSQRLGLSAWSGDALRPSVMKRLASQYSDRVTGVYVAPLGEGDAQRCLKLVDLVGAPFVLHLWDVLEGDITTGALRELVDRAGKVFV